MILASATLDFFVDTNRRLSEQDPSKSLFAEQDGPNVALLIELDFNRYSQLLSTLLLSLS